MGTAATELTVEELALLQEVERENVTWHSRSIRLWGGESDYSLATKAGRRLVELGLVSKEQAAGWRHALRGPVELTAAGRAVLARRSGSVADSPMLRDEQHRL